ncbi:MAG TPA: class I SAM-dependent methyltransferase [Cytophagaceae bacterium]|nr:class I SAM-dependent methyltransferase [Cytophagaceae bacterium]
MLLNFDHIARYYNILSTIVFGSSIHKAQLQFLDRIPENSNVLIIGGGSGKFLKEFCCWPVGGQSREMLIKSRIKKILYVEYSAEMIRLSKEAIGVIPENKLVEFRLGTEADLRNDEVFDVVITHCFLNLFEGLQLRSVMNKINSHLTPGGIWLFSDFRISSNRFHKIWQGLLTKIMYLFFRITTGLQNKNLEKFDDLFIAMQLIKVEEKFFYAKMISAVHYQKGSFMKE